jgi:DNA polymerase-3 subunit delta'
MFDHLIGNDPMKAYLSKATRDQKLPHALLFGGPAGVGKSLFAKALSACLLRSDLKRIETENHPDFHPIRPEGKSGLHSMDTLRKLIDEVHTAPFESSGKVFIIYDAERMQTASANALLKTLEEPNPDTTLILLAEHVNEILPTIRSRCVDLFFKPISEDAVAQFLKSKGYSEHFAKLSSGSLGRAIELATQAPLEKPLFSLLSQKILYPKQLLELEKIEASIEDEDPVKKQQKAEYLLSAILMWARDQHARRIGVQSLCFPNEEAVSFPLPSLELVIQRVDEARSSFQRNIKFSVCLERVLSLFSC